MKTIDEIIEYLHKPAIELAKAGCARSAAVLRLIEEFHIQRILLTALSERVADQSELLS